MLLYKIDVELADAENIDKTAQAEAMQPITAMFFEKYGHNCHITFSKIINGKTHEGILCAAVKNDILTENIVSEFLRETGFVYTNITIKEITLEAYLGHIRIAYRNKFIDDDDEIQEKLNIAELNRSRSRSSISYSESLIKDIYEKQALIARSEGLLCNTALTLEIERIFKGNIKNVGGHPVHYLLLIDNHDIRSQILDILLSALYKCNRLKSRRYCELSFSSNSYNYNNNILKELYNSCTGGTIAVSFSSETDDDEYADISMENNAKLCENIRRTRNRVLTVICLPKDNSKIKDAFMEQMGAITLVPILEEAAFDDRAREYLRSLAKSQDIRPNKSLYKVIESNKGYSSANLTLIFDEWYDRQLKTKVYTQYADFEAANKQVAVSKPKGSAIEELNTMIGLTEAKSVIKQALDYYKAQKLFKDKGFTLERPAMHMVFTGNPGTAKTSVARLFAQIMKDNGLLSDGDLYEVGRADLVGKYVGWTAQIIKKKFKLARGSVLFIDEAYSLVDDRDGLFGDEAINTIVQEMENQREDMVVIFAGYPNKMEQFLQKNPGLRSRIAFHIPFADYSADELFQITQLMADKKKISLADGVYDKLMPIYNKAILAEDSGNGRFVRNMVEKAIMKQASRLLAMDIDHITQNDVERLLPEDFEAPLITKTIKRQIGFGG